jgi:hypothetical protein
MDQQVDPTTQNGPTENNERSLPPELVGNISKVEVTLGCQDCSALLDSGSTVSTISEHFYNTYLKDHELISIDDLLEVTGAGDNKLPYLGYIASELAVPCISSSPKHFLFLVIPDTNFTQSVPILLGTNVITQLLDDCKTVFGSQFLQKAKLSSPWKVAFQCLTWQEKQLRKTDGVVAIVKNGLNKTILPPNTSCTVEGQVDNCTYFRPGTVLFQESKLSNLPDCIEITPVLLNFVGQNQKVSITLSNLSQLPVSIQSKAILGELYLVVPEGIINSHVNTNCKVEKNHLEFLDQIKFDSCSISSDQLTQLKHFLSQWSHIFSKGDTDVGKTSLVEHEIHLTDYHPFKQRHRYIPPSSYEELREHLLQLLEAGIIRRSHSPWASNVVLVRKKTGALRMCVDFRQLNQRTVKDSYALPRIEEMLDYLSGSKYFSVLDMKSGYYQIPITDDHKQFTAFTVGALGLYEFNTLPLGLCNSPATYQRFVEDVLSELNYSICLAYLDDIIIFSNSFEEHLERLSRVFERIGTAGLKFGPKKCDFFKTKINYIGHVVSEHGIETDPTKLEKVKNWPKPKNVDELRKFLGFAGYYRRFIHRYSHIAKPLNDLLVGDSPKKRKKGYKLQKPTIPFMWLEKQDTAFRKLKEALTSPPILGYPNYSLPFELAVDSSADGLGGVLYQKQDNQKRVISYASRSLTKSEKNYPTHKLEFLALKWAVTDKFYDYLFGNKFTVYTDNNPLTYVLSTAKLDTTGHRWLQALSAFDFEIVYKRGKSNIDADALSRLPKLTKVDDKLETVESNCFNVNVSISKSESDTGVFRSDFVHAVCMSHSDTLVECVALAAETTNDLDLEGMESLSTRDMKSAQCSDPLFSQLISSLKKNTKPKINQLYPSSERQQLLNEFDKLILENGVLHRKVIVDNEPKLQMVLPYPLRLVALKGLHDDIGHHGRDRTLHLVRERFYWPHMAKDVENYVKGCDRCLKRKACSSRAPLVNIKTYQPLELVCMDYLGLEPSKGGYKYILVITDHFTRYAQAIPTKSISAKTTAEALFNSFIMHYGFPKRIHSDQGGSFEGEIVKQLCNITGIIKSRTSPYHPMGNGMCERYNRTLLNMLGTLEPNQKCDWKSHVAPLVHAYNCTRHETTGFAPFELMFGRVPRLPIDIVLGVKRDQNSKGQSSYIKSLSERLKQAYDIAASNISKSHKIQKENYDIKCRAASLNPGDRVLVKITAYDGKHKIADKWENDAYEVIKQPVPDIPVYVVRRENSGHVRTLHRNLLLPIGSLPIITKPLRQTTLDSDQGSTDQPSVKGIQSETQEIESSDPTASTDLDTDKSERENESDDQIGPMKIVVTRLINNTVHNDEEFDSSHDEDKSLSDDKEVETSGPTIPIVSTEPNGIDQTPINVPTNSNDLEQELKVAPVPQPRTSKRIRKKPKWHEDYIMTQTGVQSDWAERADYLTQLAKENVFGNMPSYACDALVKIVSTCK